MTERAPPPRHDAFAEAAHDSAIDTASGDSFPASDPPGWLPLRIGAPERDVERNGSVVTFDRAVAPGRLSASAFESPDALVV